ncbi:MAG: 30S ribosomal protein S7 [Candidatus Levybacteria bacterium RBG_16_35_11]|nr:MAG: 30S ribosomal protein S7 [Candidatus Levybacteria bacterium RBG_16_35_11]
MRHKKVEKRTVEPDKVYQSRLVTKFINNLMKDGKKTVAQKIFYNAIEEIDKKGQKGVDVFEKAILNVGPKQEVKAKRIGGASYQIPIDVRGDRKTSLAIRWIIEAARARSSKEYRTFSEKLAAELLDAVTNAGAAIKKRDTAHRMAEANRAFSHFRF